MKSLKQIGCKANMTSYACWMKRDLWALYHIQGYQRRLRKAFDKKVRTRDLKLGDLVLKEIRAQV